ncbi:phosphatidic acid phosphatase type 2/haloperoxidase [Apodospora peruviana]|uniref:Phosphatidic acid phosphatase type 2/haloperoxidase n=1 Tax=Apodospora peruviana TaxID=516989 RepID=A0AAE0I0C2_9PEZI|nr:phosphatidic acid phosphatase type 2/haloperoxidase [Apodospora peruviana]
MAPSRANSPSSSGSGADYGFLGSVSRFWHKSYAADYIGFALLFTGYMVLQFFVEPFHRMFSLNDLRISFPHVEVERVPLSLDFVYALFIPMIFMIVYNFATGASPHKHHVAVLGFAIAMILTSFLTDVIKNMVGRPRPDLLARCLALPNTPRDILVSIEVCTETDHHRLHDGWRSFPSGHSSFSFAGLGYLSLFLAGKMRIFAHGPGAGIGEHTEKLVRGDLVRALLCGAPLLGATMIAISRCQDYRHDVYDVCIGALLGWTVTYWSYRRYWPRLSSSRCDEPYAGPPGADDMNATRYARVRDEEERIGSGQNVGFELQRINRT